MMNQRSKKEREKILICDKLLSNAQSLLLVRPEVYDESKNFSGGRTGQLLLARLLLHFYLCVGFPDKGRNPG